ncbi:brother of CDO-like, partial [Limulus polyphemus]|uniref:Brother of CDO-like n=1 Tax=Limulus polyphemus TaxID=6850 RepID=A0ABM1RUA9_LIMPO
FFNYFSQLLDPKEKIDPSITSNQQLVSVNKGETTYLPCAAQGQPPPTYTWFKIKGSQRERIHSSPKLQRLHGSLRIYRVELEDEGRYLCVVNNSLGEDYTQVEVKVLVPLQVRVEPHSLLVLSGGLATLTCSIAGHPIDSIVWTKNFRPLVTNGRVILRGKEVLHIKSVQKEDQGMYQCFVYSQGGSQQATAQLVVGGGLQLPVTGRQQVFPNGTLVIHQVARDSDQGKYTCTAKNIEGASDHQSVNVIIISK